MSSDYSQEGISSAVKINSYSSHFDMTDRNAMQDIEDEQVNRHMSSDCSQEG